MVLGLHPQDDAAHQRPGAEQIREFSMFTEHQRYVFSQPCPHTYHTSNLGDMFFTISIETQESDSVWKSYKLIQLFVTMRDRGMYYNTTR